MFKARSFLVLIVAIDMVFVITACSGAAVPTTSPATTPTTVPTTVTTTIPVTTPTTLPTTTPTTEPTDVPDSTTVHGDLTTYTSPHYGYTVDYPTTWVLTAAKRDWPAYEGSYPGVDAVNQWAAPTSHSWILMFVLSQQLAKGQSPSQRIAKLDRENAENACQLSHRHDVTIDGVVARQEDGKCFGHDYISEVAMVNSGRFYFVYLLSGVPFSKTTLTTFDHFVASFHFVGDSQIEANLPFPTGKFIKSGTTDYGLMSITMELSKHLKAAMSSSMQHTVWTAIPSQRRPVSTAVRMFPGVSSIRSMGQTLYSTILAIRLMIRVLRGEVTSIM